MAGCAQTDSKTSMARHRTQTTQHNVEEQNLQVDSHQVEILL